MHLLEQVDQPRSNRNTKSGQFCRKDRTVVAQPDDPSVRLIGLTLGKIAVIDALTYDFFGNHDWYAWRYPKNGAYYARRHEYIDGKLHIFLLHREIVGLKPSDKRQVDHENRDSLDYRGSNLRIASKAQNMRNRAKPRTNTSGFKGVTWCKNRKKWVAQIAFDGKHYNLGGFTEAEEAARAYDCAARKFHGPFAVLNFPVRL